MPIGSKPSDVMTNFMRNHLNRAPLSSDHAVNLVQKVNIDYKDFPSVSDGRVRVILRFGNVDVECRSNGQHLSDSIDDLRHTRPIIRTSFVRYILSGIRRVIVPAVAKRVSAEGTNRSRAVDFHFQRDRSNAQAQKAQATLPPSDGGAHRYAPL